MGDSPVGCGPVEHTSSTPAPDALVGLVIAVDGTSGSGKSSTSRGVATRLGLRYLDTGAMFRAMTWWLLREGVDVHDAGAVAARCGEPDIVSGTDPENPTITVDGTDVAVEIRGDAVNGAVSPVSAVPEVRARLLDLQRAVIARETRAGGIVVEGRDIGSVVAPDAPVKVYLSADPEARAVRRAAEQGATGATDVAATQESLLARDRIDSGRATAPLVRADGAVHIDTTPYSLEEVIGLVVGLVEDADARVRAAR
ncbi:Cytidylate kinase [Nocardioides sp. T2.26MG-1]|nr:(d)CMP kinase [Nocardioides sp. T2.26MG-1]CAI9415207.1 Cytidylate kinase [Nocardioides sp. T2.26MG-1]